MTRVLLSILVILSWGCGKAPVAVEAAPSPQQARATEEPKGVHPNFALHLARLQDAGVTLTDAALSVEISKLGAKDARAFEVAEHQVDVVLLRFESGKQQDAAFERLKKAGWGTGYHVDQAASGGMLLVVRAPKSAGDKESVMDSLLSAFAGEE